MLIGSIVYGEYTICPSMEHIVYGAHCGSTMLLQASAYKNKIITPFSQMDITSLLFGRIFFHLRGVGLMFPSSKQ